MPIFDQGFLTFPPTCVSHNQGSNTSIDSMRENSIYLRSFCTTVKLENPQRQTSSTDVLNSYDLGSRLPSQDYHEKVIQIKIPPKICCFPVSDAAAASSQLTQSQKLDAHVDSCQRT